jgi:membrane-associated phospholipid phosphatase
MTGDHRMLRPTAFLLPTLAAVSLAGCAGDTVAPDPAARAEAAFTGRKPLATLEWNRLALSMIEKHKPNQQAALRGMAYLTLAQFGAADAAQQHGQRPTVTLGAIAGSSAVVLAYLFPENVATFEDEVRAREAALESGWNAGFRAGETLGRAIGAKAVARARSDRFDAPWTGTVPSGPGIWFSSAVPPAPPVLPRLGKVQPFFMSSGDQFHPAPPPAFSSPAFQEALAEVRRISDTRTPRQDSIAKFWAMGTGTLIAGFWNSTASEIIERNRLGERAAAHALALMNTAAMDGLIACADAKFAYWLLRPSQADPAITLSIGLPNFPAYPSNHACFSGAAAYVLGSLFPDDRQRLRGMAYEAGISRVFGGIHYRFDSDVGLQIAREVTRLALESDRRNRMLDLLR